MRLRVAAFIVCAALPLTVARPGAWGNTAHRAVARVAEERLNVGAKEVAATREVSLHHRADPALCTQIRKWTTDIGLSSPVAPMSLVRVVIS